MGRQLSKYAPLIAKRHTICRKREYLCYNAEITVPIGMLEVLLSSDSQTCSGCSTSYSLSGEEPKKEELEVVSSSCGCPGGPGAERGFTWAAVKRQRMCGWETAVFVCVEVRKEHEAFETRRQEQEVTLLKGIGGLWINTIGLQICRNSLRNHLPA